VVGLEDILRVHEALARKFAESGASSLVRYGRVNGLPGFVTRETDGILQTTAFQIEGGRIAAIYIMRNPDKLRHLDAAS
jgi:RNA polymerase sigma-70 factor (ECF subfamily)